jgi:hypothetical protein
MMASAEPRPPGALRRHDVLVAGISTGVLGGAAMLVAAAVSAVDQGLGAAWALDAIGATFVGPEALDGPARIAYGALVHFAVAAAFGVVFASVVARDFPTTCAMGVGVGAALFVLGIMMSLVVPWANPGFRGEMQAVGGAWVIAHAAFGLALGAAPAIRRQCTMSRTSPSQRSPRPSWRTRAATSARSSSSISP